MTRMLTERRGREGEQRTRSSACGHAEPRNRFLSEARHQRKNAPGVGPRRQWKKVDRMCGFGRVLGVCLGRMRSGGAGDRTEAGRDGDEQRCACRVRGSSRDGARTARPSPISFPPTPQREAVMNSCGSCHNLACAAIGQRSPERWDSLGTDTRTRCRAATWQGCSTT